MKEKPRVKPTDSHSVKHWESLTGFRTQRAIKTEIGLGSLMDFEKETSKDLNWGFCWEICLGLAKDLPMAKRKPIRQIHII